MFKRILSFCVACVLIVVSCERNTAPLQPVQTPKPIVLSPQETHLVASTNRFSFELFKQACQASPEDANVFISPFSVSMALGMTLNGASGETYQAIQSTLGLSNLQPDSINALFHHLYGQLQNLDAHVDFRIANSIWYDERFPVLPQFIDLNQRYFDATVQSLNFADPSSLTTINQWVQQHTQGKISKILDRIERDAVLFLLNALYFDGQWQYAFDAQFTRQETFHSPSKDIPCQMMSSQYAFPNYLAPDLAVAQLPYGNGLFKMAVMAPEALPAFIDSLSFERWQNTLEKCQANEAVLKLPKFSFSFELKLNDILKEMGMAIAFTPQADFSRMSPDHSVFISDVRHKAFIKVNEQGTEAAAVTSVEFTRETGEQRVKLLMFNRPFLFAIYEESSGTILFMGKIVRPVND